MRANLCIFALVGLTVARPPMSRRVTGDSLTTRAIMATRATLADTFKGQATFYGGNVAGGTCSFTNYSIPSGLYGTALSDTNWNSSANCGACLSITGPDGNSIKAMVVDECPGCGKNKLNLFSDAFAKLADPTDGVIDISWSIVPCGIKTPLTLKNKEGVSANWFSMQVMNSNRPVAKLEASNDGGKTWNGTVRQDYNFFENPKGFGKKAIDIRVTSSNGDAVVVKGVKVEPKTLVTADSNFA